MDQLAREKTLARISRLWMRNDMAEVAAAKISGTMGSFCRQVRERNIRAKNPWSFALKNGGMAIADSIAMILWGMAWSLLFSGKRGPHTVGGEGP